MGALLVITAITVLMVAATCSVVKRIEVRREARHLRASLKRDEARISRLETDLESARAELRRERPGRTRPETKVQGAGAAASHGPPASSTRRRVPKDGETATAAKGLA